MAIELFTGTPKILQLHRTNVSFAVEDDFKRFATLGLQSFLLLIHIRVIHLTIKLLLYHQTLLLNATPLIEQTVDEKKPSLIVRTISLI
jgi:hypothetical protein